MPTQEQAPTKRRRVENEDSNEESKADNSQRLKTRSNEYWFEDGNVILEAENVQFRVHRSMLSLHSTVFADMFRMPQPIQPDLETYIEGCPVVTLADSADDVSAIISIFYGNMKFVYALNNAHIYL